MLRAFHPCHIGTLDFGLCPRWIFWLNFLEAVFRWHLLFLLQKNTHRKFGIKFGGKIRWKHSVFRYVFRCVFRYVFRRVFRWTAFCLEIGKIRAESVLQERPLNKLSRPKKAKLRGREETFRPPPLRAEDAHPVRQSPDPKSLISVCSFFLPESFSTETDQKLTKNRPKVDPLRGVLVRVCCLRGSTVCGWNKSGEHPGDHNHQDFPKSTAIQMGGVLRYKWEEYCDTNGYWQYFPFLRA